MRRLATFSLVLSAVVMLLPGFSYAGKLEAHAYFHENAAPISLYHHFKRPSWSHDKERTQPVAFYMQTGSLRTNVKRIATRYGWYHVVWGVPNDYDWLGKTRIHGISLADAFAKMLDRYPLQAVFYHGNHVLAIMPRTLK